MGKDVALIDEVIGVGEVALSDHRSSHPTTSELIRIAAHSRVGGMLGDKAGIVNIHLGDATDPFKPIYDAVNNSEIPIKQFFPTHCNRNNYIFQDAKVYGKLGYIDITTSSYPFFQDIEIKPSVAFRELVEAGVPVEHITMTSDAFGSLPHFDEQGNLVRLEVGKLRSLYDEWTDIVKLEGINLETALKPVTSNPAKILKLKGKGHIANGFDADLLMINDKLEICAVLAKGVWMKKMGTIPRKGTYE